jgi:hypothetical protein
VSISELQKDNSTFERKVALRSATLRELGELPVVMETHGGLGKLFLSVYRNVTAGIVFEKDPEKSAVLGRQRPTWAVYEADCLGAIQQGVGAHLTVNVLDLDPYGEPWPIVDAFFQSARPRSPRLAVVVNDGLRQKLKMNGGWNCASMREMVVRHGNGRLAAEYLAVCRELLEGKAANTIGKLSTCGRNCWTRRGLLYPSGR